MNKTIKQPDNQKDASIFTPPRRSSNLLKDCNQSKNIEKQGFFSFFSKRIFGSKFGAKPCEDFKQSIEDIIENDEDEAHIEEKTMLKNVLNFSDKKVEDIMIPRMEVNYISAELSLDELKAKIAERANISRPTLMEIEKGSAKTSMGAYLQVLSVLGLEQDLSSVAKDDRLGRKLQDISISTKKK